MWKGTEAERALELQALLKQSWLLTEKNKKRGIKKNHNCLESYQDMYQKDHTSWPSGLYPRDASILQYLQINQCNTPH